MLVIVAVLFRGQFLWHAKQLHTQATPANIIKKRIKKKGLQTELPSAAFVGAGYIEEWQKWLLTLYIYHLGHNLNLAPYCMIHFQSGIIAQRFTDYSGR